MEQQVWVNNQTGQIVVVSEFLGIEGWATVEYQFRDYYRYLNQVLKEFTYVGEL